MHHFRFKRRVIVEGQQYLIEVRRSEPRHVDRFETRWYAIVEMSGGWRATLPVPESISSTSHLWYRELIELVYQARALVNARSSSAVA
jgi:hypothetical protein